MISNYKELNEKNNLKIVQTNVLTLLTIQACSGHLQWKKLKVWQEKECASNGNCSSLGYTEENIRSRLKMEIKVKMKRLRGNSSSFRMLRCGQGKIAL